MRRLSTVWMVLCLGALLAADFSTARAQELGIKAKKPVFGASCKTCPWGALAEVLKAALQPYGYDLQICYNCWRADAPRIVADASMPPSLENNTDQLPAFLVPPAPNAPIEFGATLASFVLSAYQGTGTYANEKPRKNLRLIASIQSPEYTIVAAKADLGITDLSQIKEKRWPVRVLMGLFGASEILAHYGLTREAIESAGGRVGGGTAPDQRDLRDDFDVIIYGGTLANCPEFNIWYEVSQKYDLTYLQLPEDLLNKLAKGYGMERGTIPIGFLRGVDRPIPTVVNTGGTAIYGRADMPDNFAYTVAKAMDEHQDLLQWSLLPFFYNRRTVWKLEDVPLHPGAARYYKEIGFMK